MKISVGEGKTCSLHMYAMKNEQKRKKKVYGRKKNVEKRNGLMSPFLMI